MRSQQEPFLGYRLLEPLDGRGRGETWLAIQEDLDRKVVLKVLEPATPAELERFEVEARSLAGFEHGGLARIYDFGRTGNQFYFAAQNIEGRSLADALAAGEIQSISELLHIFVGLGEAVEHVHLNGLIHRTLNPEIVILNANGQARIADFGFARSWKNQSLITADGEGHHSPYLSPEQLRTKKAPVDHRADIFALGTMLAEGVQALGVNVGKDLQALIEKATTEDPRLRYQSAGEFVSDLKRLQRHERLNLLAEPALYRAIRWMGRHPFLSSAATLILAASVIFGFHQKEAGEIKDHYAAGRAGAAGFPGLEKEINGILGMLSPENLQSSQSPLEAFILATHLTREQKQMLLEDLEWTMENEPTERYLEVLDGYLAFAKNRGLHAEPSQTPAIGAPSSPRK